MFKIPLLALFILTVFSSCVRDIDLEQGEEINFHPKAVIDLVEFELKATNISNQEPGSSVSEEKIVPFEVVTKDLEESVVRVDLDFRYFNSLPLTIKVNISFLNDRNRIQKSVNFEIPSASKISPVSYIFTQSFVGEELESLHQSSQVKIKFEVQPGPGAIEGELRVLSTAAYYFEF